MSMETHAFLKTKELPETRIWQASIDELGYPVKLYSELHLPESRGFAPCQIGEDDSGFEIYVDPLADLRETYPQIRAATESCTHVVSFRWGASFLEAACVMAAAAGLIRCCNALVYDPQDDRWMDLTTLHAEFEECLSAEEEGEFESC